MVAKNEEQNQVTIRSVIKIVLRYKLIFFSLVLFVLFATILFTALAAKKYRASVEAIPVQRSDEASNLLFGAGGLGGLASIAGLQTEIVPLKDEALATLRSKDFLFSFIEERDLLPILFSSKWDDDAASWDVDSEGDVPTLWDGYRQLRKSVIDVYVDDLTGIITISVEWKDAVVAAEWANELVGRLNEKIRLRDIAESEKSLEYLTQELASTQIVELERSITQLMKSEINKIMIANVRKEYALRVVDKAVPPDNDQYFFPRAIVTVPIGLMLGLGMALFAVLSLNVLRSVRDGENVN